MLPMRLVVIVAIGLAISVPALADPLLDALGAEEPAEEAVEEAIPLDPPSDVAIATRLQAIYAEIEDLADIEAVVRSGVVHLTGSAPTAAASERATAIADALPGVVYVDNGIDDAPPASARVAPLLDRAEARARELLAHLPILGLAILAALPFFVLAAVLRRWEAPFKLFVRRQLIRSIVQRIVANVVIIGGILVALDVLEATAIVGAVLGAAGLAGIAIGFAFQDIAENYLASILLSVRRPFAAGDSVKIGEQEGVVVGLNTRETLLMTYEGNHLSLPNATVFKSEILNYTRNPRRQFNFLVGIGTEVDLTAAQSLGVSTLRQTPGVVVDPPPFSRVEELADFTVNVRFHGWVDQTKTDWNKARSEAIRRVKVAFDDAGVDMPVPTYNVLTRAAEPPKPSPVATGGQLDAAAHDVAADDNLARQIDEERAHQTDDLLREPGAN